MFIISLNITREIFLRNKLKWTAIFVQFSTILIFALLLWRRFSVNSKSSADLTQISGCDWSARQSNKYNTHSFLNISRSTSFFNLLGKRFLAKAVEGIVIHQNFRNSLPRLDAEFSYFLSIQYFPEVRTWVLRKNR